MGSSLGRHMILTAILSIEMKLVVMNPTLLSLLCAVGATESLQGEW